jgi:hypothetical protein
MSRRTSCQKLLPRRVAVAAHVEHEPADGVRASPAVIDELLPVPVAMDALVLLEGVDQILEGPGRNLVALDRPAQGDEYGMARLAAVAGGQLLPPPAEQLEGALRVAGLVAEIVRPAAEGVDVGEIAPQPPRQQPADDGEVLVVRAGEPGGVGRRLLLAERLASVGAEAIELFENHRGHGRVAEDSGGRQRF